MGASHLIRNGQDGVISTLREIEAAIADLPSNEFWELMSRLEERRQAEWDRQMEEDARSGKLDRLYAALEKENAAPYRRSA